MSLQHRPRLRIALALATAAAVPAAIVYLYALPPTEGSYYPRCVWNWLTGLNCPGCGITRALHALVHGNLAQAAAYNLMFLLLLPFLVVWGVRTWFGLLLGVHYKPLVRFPPWTLYTLFGVLLAFWVVRNVPVHPFTLLAPHELEGPNAVSQGSAETTDKPLPK